MRLSFPIIVAIACAAPSGLLAQPVPPTFAGFTGVSPGDLIFVYDNNEQAGASAAASLTTPSASPGVAVKFDFSSDLVFSGDYVDLNQEQNAFMVLNSTSSAAATPGALFGIPNAVLTQEGFSGTLSFVRSADINGYDRLLDVTFTNAFLKITFGSVGALMAIDVLAAASVEFDSDFITFVDSGADHFSISLTSIQPPTSIQSNGMLQDFQAAGNGTFAGSVGALIPEPSAYAAALALAGFLGTAWMRRRREA